MSRAATSRVTSRGVAVGLLAVSALVGFVAAAQPATGLAVLALATIPALFAVPPRGRLWLGLVVAAMGVAVTALGDPGDDAIAWVATAALATAGVVIAAKGRQWSTLGRRYDPTADVDRRDDPHELWRALDRGEDPTAGDSPGTSAGNPRSDEGGSTSLRP